MAKTIEQLENDFWGEPTYPSHLVISCHRLRQKPIDEFGVEDLRLMIGQNIGTQYLLPRVLGLLEQTPLVTDYHYPGELVYVVFKIPDGYWNAHPEHVKRVCGIARLTILKLIEQCERNKKRAFHFDGTFLNDHKCLSAVEHEIKGLAEAFLLSWQPE